MKGMVTQGAVLLTAGPMSLSMIASALSDYEVGEKNTGTGWEFGDPAVVVPLRCDPRGRVIIDYVARPWPDGMGDPQNEFTLFGAWSMGHFGPFTYPRGLERAVQQAWNWREARDVVPRHDGFIRLKTTYVGGPNDLVIPEGYNALAELNEVTAITVRLSTVPGVLCYFNPNGETLYLPTALAENFKWNASKNLPSVNLWTNVRMFNLANQVPGWFMMDTVGMWQLDLPDQEVVHPDGAFDPDEVAGFLRDISVYLVQNGRVIKDGDTTDGPGGIRWQAFSSYEGVIPPPRETLRWYPENGVDRPRALAPKERPQKESKPQQ